MIQFATDLAAAATPPAQALLPFDVNTHTLCVCVCRCDVSLSICAVMIIVNQTSPNNTRKREEKKNHRSQLGLMFHGSLKKGDETGPILWFPLFSHS